MTGRGRPTSESNSGHTGCQVASSQNSANSSACASCGTPLTATADPWPPTWVGPQARGPSLPLCLLQLASRLSPRAHAVPTLHTHQHSASPQLCNNSLSLSCKSCFLISDCYSLKSIILVSCELEHFVGKVIWDFFVKFRGSFSFVEKNCSVGAIEGSFGWVVRRL
jgi:hypothetical protein